MNIECGPPVLRSSAGSSISSPCFACPIWLHNTPTERCQRRAWRCIEQPILVSSIISFAGLCRVLRLLSWLPFRCIRRPSPTRFDPRCAALKTWITLPGFFERQKDHLVGNWIPPNITPTTVQQTQSIPSSSSLNIINHFFLFSLRHAAVPHLWTNQMRSPKPHKKAVEVQPLFIGSFPNDPSNVDTGASGGEVGGDVD